MHEAQIRARMLEAADQGIALVNTQTGLAQQACWFVHHQQTGMIENEGQPSQLTGDLAPWPTSDHRADGLDGTSK